METLFYTDFDYFASSAQLAAVLTTTGPLVGTASLQITRVSGSAVTSVNVVPKVEKRQGTTTGQLRVLFKHTVGGSTSQQFGLFCMQSQRDLRTSGAAYGLRVRGTNLDLVKMSGGMVIANLAQLATVGGLMTFNTLHAIELRWAMDVTQLGGVLLTAWHGSAADYSSMTQVLSYQDIAAPLTTTVSEGLFAIEGFGGAFAVLMDQLNLEGI